MYGDAYCIERQKSSPAYIKERSHAMTAELIKTEWFSYRAPVDPSMKKWARRLTSYDEVPSGFEEEFPEYTSQFPYTVLIPEEESSSRFQNNREAMLLCLDDEQFVIIEAIRGKAVATSYPLDSITYIEHGRVLLKSWLKVSSPWFSTTVMFNTASESVLRPVIEAIRPKADSDEPESLRLARHQQEVSQLGYLWKTNFKYFTLAKQSILPGERVLETVYQPDIRINTLNLFKKPVFSKYLTGHLAILTDKELILIRESKRTKSLKETLYGRVLTYIPRSQIKDISFERDTGKTDYAMNITLKDKARLRSEFLTDSVVNLEVFKEACAYNNH
jgi:hypothetical protein